MIHPGEQVSRSRALSLTLTHANTHAHTHTNTNTNTNTHTHTHTHTHTQTHTNTHTHTHKHTHTHTHTQTHTRTRTRNPALLAFILFKEVEVLANHPEKVLIIFNSVNCFTLVDSTLHGDQINATALGGTFAKPDQTALLRVVRCILCKSAIAESKQVQGSGFRVQGSGFRVQGAGFRVQVQREPAFLPEFVTCEAVEPRNPLSLKLTEVPNFLTFHSRLLSWCPLLLRDVPLWTCVLVGSRTPDTLFLPRRVRFSGS